MLDYPNSDALKLKEQKHLLEDAGIYLEEFGQNSFIVRAHPTWYPNGEEESIIREMIDMLLTTGSVSVKKFREATAIMMSCKRSIKANHYLNEAQARAAEGSGTMRKSFQLSPWPSSIDSLYQFGYGKDVQTNPRPALSQREEGKHEDCISIPITKKKRVIGSYRFRIRD